MLTEFLFRFFSFDVSWLIGFVLNPANLLWLFMLGAAAFFFYCNGKDKSWFWSTVFVVFYIWASLDFSRAVGWQLLDANLLGFLMMAGLIVLAFFDKDSWGKNRLPMLNTLRFILIFVFFNVVLGA